MEGLWNVLSYKRWGVCLLIQVYLFILLGTSMFFITSFMLPIFLYKSNILSLTQQSDWPITVLCPILPYRVFSYSSIEILSCVNRMGDAKEKP